MDRAVLRYLEDAYGNPIRDPLWRHVRISDGLLRLMQLPAFQQLRGIKQLGPAYLVYPGATHTRFSHSIGVFHVARAMLQQLLRASPDWRPSTEEAAAFLCAALVHDVGHYPFAHSLKDLEVRPHEELTAEWALQPAVAECMREQVRVDPHLVAAIVDHRRPAPAGTDVDMFRRLLSGVLDPDKLDYLNRDAYFCGVPYGIQDTDFVLGELVRFGGRLAITAKGLLAVEAILFARYLMHRTVYWHKTVRVATAMIKKAVLKGLAERQLTRDELYGLDDEGFQRLLAGREFAPFRLAERTFRRDLLKVGFSMPFREELPLHVELQAPEVRHALEEQAARELSTASGVAVAADEVIIDVPEPIDFEVDLAVLDDAPVADPSDTSATSDPSAAGNRRELVGLMQSATVFSSAVVAGFRRRLRSVSLITPRDEAVVRAAAGLGRELLHGNTDVAVAAGRSRP